MEIAPRLLSVAQARQLMLSYVAPLSKRRVPIRSALGNFLAEPVFAPIDIPSFTNSSMDGFAVVAKDTRDASPERPVVLNVVGDVPAGIIPEKAIRPGETMRVMTGAMIPLGADAVVPLEHTDLQLPNDANKVPGTVRVFRPAKPGDYIRGVGEDVKKGKKVLEVGKFIRAQEVGFLAMLGVKQVVIHRKPRVGLFSSGNEILTLGERLIPGKIYDANSFTLSALIRGYGAKVVQLGIAEDTESSVKQILDRALDLRLDLILSSAGVSVGAFDCVRTVIEKNGLITFWKVNMRPGKPLAFGNYGGIPFIGLPGNPVSAFVGCEVFVRPLVLKMRGGLNFYEQRIRVRLMEPIESDGRESYLRGIVKKDKDRFVAHLAEHQGSGNLYSLVKANAFLIVPSEVKSLPIGAEIDAWLMEDSETGMVD